MHRVLHFRDLLQIAQLKASALKPQQTQQGPSILPPSSGPRAPPTQASWGPSQVPNVPWSVPLPSQHPGLAASPHTPFLTWEPFKKLPMASSVARMHLKV